MTLSISTRLAYEFATPTDFLLQIEAAVIPEQRLSNTRLTTTPSEYFTRVSAQDDVGDRIWMRHEGPFEINYAADVAIERMIAPIEDLPMVAPHDLPAETVQYLMDSRYCPATHFQHFIDTEFAHETGGARIAAMRDWIAASFSYEAGSSNSDTTAIESFVERRGVCRDYAHTLIAFARAAAIPARFASVYAPDVTPMDFHAVAEVFLADPTVDAPGAGSWHLVDPTGMAKPEDIAKIAIGRDAADCSFITFYGSAELVAKDIAVTRTG
ncbi:transglutaminase family protein [Novosphingobium tardum]|uniref:Transglutaminase family protein n=1 Tax=Novosphingobium tardum TaxID=1538021 RepID=A0ABV8RPW5_9SPHN